MGRSSSMRLIIIHIVCALVLCFCDSASSQSFVGDAPPRPPSGVRFFNGLLNLTIPNYGMISDAAFRSQDFGIGSSATGDVGENDGQNDGLWCQSANNGNNIGTWMQPNGDTLGTSSMAVIYMTQTEGQVGLLRNGLLDESGITTLQGLYQCMILDESGISQTLVVWIGTRDVFAMFTVASLSQDLQFVPPSQPRDSNPPEYSLTFIVNDIPPTYVTCVKDDSVIDDANISRKAMDANYAVGDSTSVLVTLTLKTRDAADYKCNMTFFKLRGVSATDESMIAPEDTVPAVTTALISISVTDLPTGLTAVRTEYNIVEFSWSSPASNIPPVAGYEVFYSVFGSGSTQSGGTTTATSATLSIGLTLGNTYEFFVVAYSDAMNALPSAHSNNVTMELNVPQLSNDGSMSTANSITVSWTTEFNPTSYTLTSVCVQLCDGTSHPQTTPTPQPAERSATISGLPPTSQCTITLIAVYGSENSNTLELLANTHFPAPDDFRILSVTKMSVTVSWVSANCSSGVISGYTIQYTVNGSSVPTFTPVNGIDTSEHTLTGLTPCTNYSLKIATRSSVGDGVFSEAKVAMTSNCTMLVPQTEIVPCGSSSQSTTIAVGIGLSVLLLMSVCVIIALLIVLWRTRKTVPAKSANVSELQNIRSRVYSEVEPKNTLKTTECVAYNIASKTSLGPVDTVGSVYEAIDL